MGLSDPGTTPHLLATAAEDVAAVLASLGVQQAAIVGHDWGGAVGATLALSHRDAANRLVFIESALAGAGFEQFWRFDAPNPALTFIPFLLMGAAAEALTAGREEVFLHHLWDTFTADKAAAPFEAWAPYVAALRRPGQFSAAADYYRCAYRSAEDTKRLLAAAKLAVPVLPIAGALSLGAANEEMAKNFAADVRPGLVLEGAGHFVPEERPREVLAALQSFLA
jgi:pimeloyl-ACP methyl ester carboxylesterase